MTNSSRRPSSRLTSPFFPQDTTSQQELADALAQFLRATDWVASLRVLLSHPVLLSEHVSKLLRDSAAVFRRNGNNADEMMLLSHLIFIQEVRRRGFFQMLIELQEKSVRL